MEKDTFVNPQVTRTISDKICFSMCIIWWITVVGTVGWQTEWFKLLNFVWAFEFDKGHAQYLIPGYVMSKVHQKCFYSFNTNQIKFYLRLIRLAGHLLHYRCCFMPFFFHFNKIQTKPFIGLIKMVPRVKR